MKLNDRDKITLTMIGILALVGLFSILIYEYAKANGNIETCEYLVIKENISNTSPIKFETRSYVCFNNGYCFLKRDINKGVKGVYRKTIKSEDIIYKKVNDCPYLLWS